MIELAFSYLSKNEYVACGHIIVFQIESILRQILKLNGKETYNPKKYGDRDIPLGEIMRIISDNSYLDNDLIRYIEITLNDQVGLNIRNEIAHGKVGCDDFTEELCMVLTSIMLKVVKTYKVH